MEQRLELLKHSFKTIEQNERFLYEKAKYLYEEIIGLSDDSINCLRLINKKNYLSQAKTFFLVHILMPQSYALYIDLLTGNLPVCFIEIRIMVESLAKSYYADQKYADETFVRDKYLKLEKDLKAHRFTVAKAIKDVENETGIKGDMSTLWTHTSRSWVHSEGIANKLFNSICERDISSWGLIVPMTYKEADLFELNELKKYLSMFRAVISSVIPKCY